MKLSLVLALSILTSVAFAGEKYICTQADSEDFAPKKLVLTQIGHEEVQEGKTHSFKLELFQGRDRKALVSETVSVRTEDVMFSFSNKSKKISGMIYMDELDQTWLKIGKEEMHFDCN
jgi:hypothetical protein